MEESNYCPVCFNLSLDIHEKAVVTLLVNKLKRDNGNFIARAEDKHEVFVQSLEAKLKEFFSWYAQFKNRATVEEIQLITSSVSCRQNCKLPLDNKVNLVGILIGKKELIEIVKKIAALYHIDTNIHF
ncbi:MAG: hypothetical protein U0T83_01115 [Bacteriovoracaceae bacterium]